MTRMEGRTTISRPRSDMVNILDRMDAWKKAERTPERTSSFLRDDPVAGDTDKAAPKFGGDVHNSATAPMTLTDLKKGEDGEKNPDGCGCPVSAALNSIQEEAEAMDLYNKRANKVQDPHSREVYRDIALEEAAHMGEAAQLLSETDPELAQKVHEGMTEAQDIGRAE